jgi:hypothetical protein
MPLRTQRAVLAAKVEATEGTAETLTATERILALSASFQRNAEMMERNPFRPTLSQLASIPGKRTANLQMVVEGKGATGGGIAPEYGTLLKGCGFSEVIVASTSVTYAPISTGDPSLTVGLYTDGMRQMISGARGTFTMGGAVGEGLMFNFNFQGVQDLVTDVALLAPTYLATVPVPMLGMTFTVHGVTTLFCSNFSIDLGMSLSPRQDFVKTSGYASVMLGDRKPVCNFVVEKPLVAGKDWYGIWSAGTEGAISLVLGSVAGNVITIAAPKFQVTNITEQDDNGRAMLSIDGKLNMNAGDDELTIAYT